MRLIHSKEEIKILQNHYVEFYVKQVEWIAQIRITKPLVIQAFSSISVLKNRKRRLDEEDFKEVKIQYPFEIFIFTN